MACVSDARGAVATLLAASVFMACSATTPAYVDSRDDWTRQGEVWEDFQGRLFVDATLKNEQFRREYVREYTRLFALTPDQATALLASELAEEEEQHVVMAAVFFGNPDWEELDPSHGIWAVRLQNDAGDWLPPTQVKRLDTDNPTWRQLYPFIDPHDAFFELRFDRQLDDGTPLVRSGAPVHLVIAGAPAQMKLTWRAP